MLSLVHFLSAGAVLLRGGATAPTIETRVENSTQYSAIVAFGDSFTDNGSGAWVASNHTWPADPGYDGGRFSNGPIWVEYVASHLSVPLLDLAIGGATSSNAIVQGATGPGSAIPVASVDEQVADFIISPPSDIPLENPLFVLLAGANDPLFDPNVTASQSFQAIQSSKVALAAKYPTAQFLFLTYPDLARLPVGFYFDARTKRELTTFTNELAALYEHAQAVRAGERFAYVDLRALFEDFEYYGSPAEYGFAPLGKYGSCLTGVYGETEEVTVCDDADKMVYWDEYHPSTHAHSWIAKLVLDALN
ncbi:SGNH hydrolase-type esterase domain-containing protein [Fomes fomentarius]|nr:SGNH hydrolase-type esterase domain-containing protein [Fomes fomentarius]